MKRADALRSLSRDHHQALVIAQALTRADESNAGERQAAFLDFWRAHGHRHFQVEEEVLLPFYAGFADVRTEPVVRVLTDHVEIRRMAQDLEQGPAAPVDSLHALGGRLADHVRHEERVLFPMIEDALPDERLAELASAVAHAEALGT